MNDLSEAYNLYRTLSPESELSQMKAEYLVWTAMWKNASVDVPTTAIGALNSCSSAVFPIVRAECKKNLANLYRGLKTLLKGS